MQLGTRNAQTRNAQTQMHITVIGAGSVGAAVAYDLIQREEVNLVQICDTRSRSLQALHERIDAPSLRSFQVDVRDHSVLPSILEGSDCVVGCMPSHLHPELAQLCLSMNLPYCDLGGNDEVVRQELALDDEARAQSTWIVPNCGLAPGLSNVLCLHGVDQFDEVEAAHLRVGDVPLHPEPPFNFRVSWSAEKIIDDYVNPVRLIEDGEIAEYDSLSRQERIAFPEPFGEMEAFCTAGGLSTLTSQLADRLDTLDHKTIRWPGHADQMRFLLELGFGEDRTIDVRTHLTYRDVLVRQMRKRLGGEYADAVLLRVLIRGTEGGEKRTLVYEMVDRYDEDQRLSAMERCTSLPIAAVAVFIAGGEVEGGGAAPPENVVPRDRYLDVLAERGLDVQTRWYDGHTDVTDEPDEMAA